MKSRRALRALSIPLLAALAAQTVAAAAPQTPAAHFRAFDARGRAVGLAEIVAALDGADVLILGETHDDAVAHMLEAELLRLADERASERGRARAVTLSLEMFERDVQLVLDEYLAGLISERHFMLSSRPWRNYQSDYRPLVEYAKGRQLPVIAANAPARYVSRVTANGPASLAALSAAARAWLTPLPFAPASEAYAAKFNRFLRSEEARAASPHQRPPAWATPGAQAPHAAPPNPHAVPPNPHAAAPPQGPHGAGAAPGAFHLLDAQNLRDASMAHAISEHLRANERALVVHVNGAFHSEGRLGVPEHLKLYRPRARVLVVTLLAEGFTDFDAARHPATGDFVILTDPALPRTSQ
jgi:uncharacterized iron-regulated protein